MFPGAVSGALALTVIAHATPWAAGRLLGARLGAPLDRGMRLGDGARLLGDHKTWRGLLASILACALGAVLLGHGAGLGATFGLLAMLGDCASSFVKRRLRLAPGREIFGLDQLPEALLPLLALAGPLGISLVQGIGVGLLFALLDLASMRLRHPR